MTAFRASLHRTGWGLLATALLVLLVSLFQQPVGIVPRMIVVTILVTTLTRPAYALLLLLPLQAMAETLLVATRATPIGMRYAEALTVAFLAGWSLRLCARPRRLRADGWVLWSASGLGILVVASLLVNVAIAAAEHPGETRVLFFTQLFGADYLYSAEPLAAACLFGECVLLLLATSDVCEGDPAKQASALRMLALGAGAGATISLLRLITAALHAGRGLHGFATLLATARINVNFPDVNAAGSYFCLMVFVAAGFLPTARGFGAVTTLLALLGLWMAGSRVALVVLMLGFALMFARSRSRPASRSSLKRTAIVILAAACLVAGAAWKWYPADRNVDSGYAVSFRLEMARTALHLAAEQPVFGIGLGRFYGESERFASMRENAHNNFLQVLAELGILGLGFFVSVLALTLRSVRRDQPIHESAAIGTAAYIATCLGGHPLLIAGAAYPFWTVLGVLASAPASQPRARSGRWAMGALLVLTAVTLPFRINSAVRGADLEHATVAFAPVWQVDASGTRYRWAGGRAAFFVPSGARAIALPLKAPDDAGPLRVRIAIDGRPANAILVDGRGWTIVRLGPARRAVARFTRIDLETGTPDGPPLDVPVTRTSGAIKVGKPQITQ